MNRNGWLWIVAVSITLVAAAWQRRTGPTYPVKGTVSLGGHEVRIQLERSNAGESDQPVRIRVDDEAVSGEVAWRRFPTSDPWAVMPLRREGEWLAASLPHQPPAGKLEYQIRLARGDERRTFPALPAVTRFKGGVPVAILAPHVLMMFVGMLLSTRTGLEALSAGGEPRRLGYATLGVIVVGGLILGPIVQKYAFGAFWTGAPFGYDLTDNKTLIAAVAWAWAAWRTRGGRGRWDVVAAALVTLVVFAIPHSVWGSQLTWGQA